VRPHPLEPVHIRLLQLRRADALRQGVEEGRGHRSHHELAPQPPANGSNDGSRHHA
jgi:hypothetical protein